MHVTVAPTRTSGRPHLSARLGFSGLLLLSSLSGPGVTAGVIRVAPGGDDGQTGANWDGAKRTVTAALAAAARGDEIWVAAGTYAERITLKDGVRLLGGFGGTEATAEDRAPGTHATVLDGQQKGIVVTVQNSASGETWLDGFHLTGGNGIHGGGIKSVGSAPRISQNFIYGNHTEGAGAGISIWGFRLITTSLAEQPVIRDNVIVGNRAGGSAGDGGGIAVVGSSPLIQHNLIARNEATRNGGGLCCWRSSSPTITHNRLEGNSASVPLSESSDAGTSSTGGGALFASATDLDGRPIDDAVSAPYIESNVIVANAATIGGGLTLVDSIRTDLGVAVVRNNTLAANSGSGVFWYHRVVVLENNIVAFNTIGFEFWPGLYSGYTNRFNLVHGNHLLGQAVNYRGLPDLTGTNGHLDADPQFANLRLGNLHLQPTSPAVDTGIPGAWPIGSVDLDGQARVQNGQVDLGADESDGTAWNVSTPVFHVRAGAAEGGDGKSWATALRSVQAGISTAAGAGGGEVWVAEGTYAERITLPAFVYLYGGFAGTETSRDNRVPGSHPAILQGGGVPTVVRSANAGYLVSALDGFTIEGGGVFSGGGTQVTPTTGLGAGVYARVSSPHLTRNVIRRNSVGTPYAGLYGRGGGLAAVESCLVVEGNQIFENEVLAPDGQGGGIYLSSCRATVLDNELRQNRAKVGSGLHALNSQLWLRGNLIESNRHYVLPPLYQGATDAAVKLSLCTNLLVERSVFRANLGAFGGGLHLDSCSGARVQNNLFVSNAAYDYSASAGGWGGAIFGLINQNAIDDVVIAHNTIAYNTASHRFFGEQGGALAFTLIRPRLVVANNVLAFNSSGIWRNPGSLAQPTLTRNCVFNSNRVDYLNVPAGATDLNLDPRFTDPAQGDFQLQKDSPALEVGDASISAFEDLTGRPRPLDGKGDGLAGTDLGAFERLEPTADSDHDGLPDGWEWAHGLDLVRDDAAADLDQDGLTNAGEFGAGTDPRDRASTLRLEILTHPGDQSLRLRWPTVLGRSYQLMTCPGLSPDAAWSPWGGEVAGTNSPVEIALPLETTARFLRVEVR